MDHDDVLLVEALTSDGSHSIEKGVLGEGVGVMNWSMVVDIIKSLTTFYTETRKSLGLKAPDICSEICVMTCG
jgi:hypothetical protein